MDLFLIRHGQSTNNALADATQRVSDPGLTPLGQSQAAHVAACLTRGGHLRVAERQDSRAMVDVLYCSPMQRALQTAAVIGQALGRSPQVWLDVHEVGGVYVNAGPGGEAVGQGGLSRTGMLEVCADAVIPAQVIDTGWWSGDMESFHAGQGRAIGVASELRERAVDDTRVVIVTHGGFASCVLQALGRQLPADGFYYEHGNTGITRIQLSTDVPVILHYMNRLAHLPDDMRS